MSSKVKKNSTMIRVPNELKAELEALAAEMLVSYQEGRTTDVEITEQGGRGEWVALHEVIRKTVKEYRDHQARGKKANETRKAKRQAEKAAN